MAELILPADVAASRPRKRSLLYFMAQPVGLRESQLSIINALHEKWLAEAREALDAGNETRAAYAYGWCAYLDHVIAPQVLGLASD